MRLKFAFLIIFLLLGCGKDYFTNKDHENPLASVDRYYKWMQWKYYEKSASLVYPEDILKFDEATSRIKDDLNITSYEIKELIILDEEDKEQPTNVRVVVTYYKYPSVSEKTVEITDTWYKQKKVWLIKSDFDSEIFTD